MAMEQEKKLYTVTELAGLAKLNVDYVRELCRKGDILAEKVGSVWIIKQNEVTRFLSSRDE